MTNEVDVKRDPMEEFRDKLQKRVREDIRDLIPEDAIEALVKRAVEDEFFKPSKEFDHSTYASRVVECPSWFVKEVVKAVTPIMNECVQKFVEENKELIEKQLQQFFERERLCLLVTEKLTDKLNNALMDLNRMAYR